MDSNRGRFIRNIINLSIAVLLIWIYIPALLVFLSSGKIKEIVESDLDRIKDRIGIKTPYWLSLVYFMHTDRYFRSLFYYRLNPVLSFLISWIRPGDKYFILSRTMRMGKGCWVAHPYATVLNAERIGDNFSCIHGTTIGDSYGKRPIIGNNVSLCANVTIVGGVHIGDNVLIGAGSVVVKDIPSNCVAAGNPAKVIKKLS